MCLAPLARTLAGLCLAGLCLAGCATEIPDATYVCATTAECPPGLSCARGLCVRDPGDGGTPTFDAGPCVPRTCGELRANCGMIDDGCGTPLSCGDCVAPETCGGGGLANLCDCTATACQAGQCGSVAVGCGFMVDCGHCPGGENCVDGVCVCPLEVCNGRCGMPPDGCGGLLDCGGCAVTETCGGGGRDRCGGGLCTPDVCPLGTCGVVSDGCGGTATCLPCPSGLTCGGGDPGVAGVCGCTPRTCGSIGADCDTIPDGCGGNTAPCGTCTGPETCGGGGQPNRCGCMPPVCAPGDCGLKINLCGTTTCAGCASGEGCAPTGRCVCSDPGEEDDTFTSASLQGVLADGVSLAAIVDRKLLGMDEDFFRWNLVNNLSGSHAFTGHLTSVPGGADFALEVFTNCGSVVCTTGTYVTRPDAAVFGCRSDQPGSVDEEAALLASGCINGSFFVRVAPTVPSMMCDAYHLDVDYERLLPTTD